MATLGKYELIREVGAGGMSTVYEASTAPSAAVSPRRCSRAALSLGDPTRRAHHAAEARGTGRRPA